MPAQVVHRRVAVLANGRAQALDLVDQFVSRHRDQIVVHVIPLKVRLTISTATAMPIIPPASPPRTKPIGHAQNANTCQRWYAAGEAPCESASHKNARPELKATAIAAELGGTSKNEDASCSQPLREAERRADDNRKHEDAQSRHGGEPECDEQYRH
jgi:hypothetical protein